MRRPAIITSTARLQSELREAGIVPGSETDAMRTVRSCFNMTVAARPAWGTSLAPNDDAAHAVRQAWHPGIFGTPVQVTALETGQAIMVRIKDGGPFGRGRIIDLSRAAADQLGTRHDGVARGRLEPTGSAEAG